MSDQSDKQNVTAPSTLGADKVTTGLDLNAAVSAPHTSIPPIQPGGLPQVAGIMLQHTIGQTQQNPEVTQHLCTFLSHDSDNRLNWFKARDQKSHIFRMTALIIFTILSALVLSIPLVALWRGDMVFVKEFLEKYLTQFIIVMLALLGGGKLFDLFK